MLGGDMELVTRAQSTPQSVGAPFRVGPEGPGQASLKQIPSLALIPLPTLILSPALVRASLPTLVGLRESCPGHLVKKGVEGLSSCHKLTQKVSTFKKTFSPS